MKNHLVVTLSLFLLFISACSGVGALEETPTQVDPIQERTTGEEPTKLVEESTLEVTEPLTEEATELPTEESGGLPAPDIEVNGGFSSDYREVNDLPNLRLSQVGLRGPYPCERNSSDVPLTFISHSERDGQLCIFDYPAAVGSPPITLTLTAPDGQSYTEIFRFVQNRARVAVAGESERSRGGFVDEMAEPPAIVIWLDFTADLPLGTWSVHSDNGGLSADATFEREISQGFFNVFDTPAEKGPFSEFDAFQTLFDTADTVHVVGANYAPNSELVVAAYTPIPGIEPEGEFGTLTYHAPYATTVKTDAAGSFATAFIVGSATPNGKYMIAVGPFSSESIDPFMGLFFVRTTE